MKVAQLCPTLYDPIDCSPPGPSVHGILQARILKRVAFSLSRGFLNPRIKPRSPALQADSLPSEPSGEPRNTGVGSLSLLQGISPTQELNQALLHCRRILYTLSYQESPIPSKHLFISHWPNGVTCHPGMQRNLGLKYYSCGYFKWGILLSWSKLWFCW